MIRPRHFLALAALAATAAPLAAQQTDPAGTAQPAAPGSLRAAAGDFIEAFNALDQARFDAFWAEDATLFFPGFVPQHRADRVVGSRRSPRCSARSSTAPGRAAPGSTSAPSRSTSRTMAMSPSSLSTSTAPSRPAGGPWSGAVSMGAG